MDDNLTLKKTNNKREAIASLVLGIIIVTFLSLLILKGEKLQMIIAVGMGWLVYYLSSGETIRAYEAPILGGITTLFLPFFLGIIGLILGKLGLKSTKRNLAKIGIVLCIIGLLAPVIYIILIILF